MSPNIAAALIPPTPAARREWIKYLLAARGLTLSSLAAQHDLSRKTVQKALDCSYPKVEQLIANALEMKPQQLWPERFDAKGNRVRRRGRQPASRIYARGIGSRSARKAVRA